MKSTLFLFAIGTSFLLSLPDSALALAGNLERPGVALNAGYPADAAQQVRAALERPDCKYLGGRFVNSSTTLDYQGTTDALGKFLEALTKCPGASLSVSFTREALPKEGSDWSVSHQAHGHHFHVRVNLDSKQIDLTKLVIPMASGPALPPAAANSNPETPAK